MSCFCDLLCRWGFAVADGFIVPDQLRNAMSASVIAGMSTIYLRFSSYHYSSLASNYCTAYIMTISNSY